MTTSRRVRRLRKNAKTKATARQQQAQRAVGYCRVSTEEQAGNGYSIEAQQAAIRAFATSQGYELIDTVVCMWLGRCLSQGSGRLGA